MMPSDAASAVGIDTGTLRRLRGLLAALHASDVRAAFRDACLDVCSMLGADAVALYLRAGDVLEGVAACDDAGAARAAAAAPEAPQALGWDDCLRILDAAPTYGELRLGNSGTGLLPSRPVEAGSASAPDLLLAPVEGGGKLVGVLVVGFPASVPQVDDLACATLELLASQLGIAVHQEEQRAAAAGDHRALRLSEERFRLAFDNAPIGMVEFVTRNDELEVARINRAAGAMFGLNVYAVQSSSIDDVLTVAEGETMGAAMQRLLDEDRRGLRLEVPFVDVDGREFWGLVEAASLLDVDGHAGIICQIVDITQAKADAQELTKRAQHDPLTGLPNRRLLLERLHAVVRSAQVSGELGALLFCDLDDFKSVNDKHGHLVGDEALAELAARLNASVRKTDIAGRFGGDEFVVVAHPVTQEEAQALGERISAALSEPMILDGAALRVGVSVGIAMITGSMEAAEVLRRADAAMYAARLPSQRPPYVLDTA